MCCCVTFIVEHIETKCSTLEIQFPKQREPNRCMRRGRLGRNSNGVHSRTSPTPPTNTNGQRGLDGDIPIWHNKFHLREPLLCDGDGPIMRFRKYFAQFYVGGPYGDEGEVPTDLEAVS